MENSIAYDSLAKSGAYFPPSDSGRKDGRTCRLSRGRVSIPWAWMDDMGITLHHQKTVSVEVSFDEEKKILDAAFYQNGDSGLKLEICRNYGNIFGRLNVSSILKGGGINSVETNAFCGTMWNLEKDCLQIVLPIKDDELYRKWVPREKKSHYPVAHKYDLTEKRKFSIK